MFKATETSISTAVCNINTYSDYFDVENIFRYLELNEIFLGVKWHNNYRGKRYEKKRTGCLFNQVTIPIWLNEINKEVNLKVFNNGKIQATGVKNETQARLAVNILLKEISNKNGINVIDIHYEENIAFNKEEYFTFINKPKERFNSVKFYDVSLHKQIGEKKSDDLILFFGKERINVVHHSCDIFIEKGNIKITDRIVKRRLFCKYTGNHIGDITYTFVHKKRTIEYGKYDFIMINKDVYDIYDKKYSKSIGTKTIVIFEEKNESENKKTLQIKIPYKFVQKTNTKEYTYDMTNINSNFQILLHDGSKIAILREKFNNILIEKFNLNCSCRLDSRYPAIKLRFLYDEDFKLLGNDAEDYIYSNSLSIFENGQVLVFGSTTEQQISVTRVKLLEIFNATDNIIKKPKQEITIKDKNLDIFDFI